MVGFSRNPLSQFQHPATQLKRMSDILLAIFVSAIAFLATNLENQLILLAYLNHPRYSFPAVSAGYVGATALILLVSYGFSRLTQLVPTSSIHYLGFLPIWLGVWEFFKLVVKSETSSIAPHLAIKDGKMVQKVAAVGTATLASGGDSLAVFIPLFSDAQHTSDLVMILTGIGMAFLWVKVAEGLSRNAWLSAQMTRYGHVLLPLLLIAIGLYILMDTPIDID